MSTQTTDVRIDPPLDADPSAVRAISDTMAYLRRQAGYDSASLSASWRPYYDRPEVEFQLTEDYQGSELHAGRVLPRQHLDDPTLRHLWALRVWGDILSLRTARNQDRIREMIRNLPEDFDDGGSDDSPGRG